MDQRSLDDLTKRFSASSLSYDEWTHEAHLAVGLWHVDRFGADEALTLLRDGILRLNDRHGTPNSATSGYHETITRAYVALLSGFLKSCPTGKSPAERVSLLLETPLADKAALFVYYSRETLMSAEARAGWVEPDLRPLPGPL